MRIELTPASVGFLGSYVFALMTVLRGYQRGDLRPKTYMAVSQRVFVVTALCWVLQVVTPAAADNPVLLAGCFVAGLVPETALAGIQRRAAISPVWFTPNGGLLSDLDGMDLYDESRLREEGITCVQAFAKHSFIELTLSTRIPVARLVDWLDQAVLRLHTGADLADVLAKSGIRTATEFLVVHDAGAAVGTPEVEGRLAVLALALRGDDHTPSLVDWKQPPRPAFTATVVSEPLVAREPVDNGLTPKPVPA